jgi:DNA-binding NarL/FixJ family response regulator
MDAMARRAVAIRPDGVMKPQDMDTDAVSRPPGTPPACGDRLRVVIADDHAILRSSLAQLLAQYPDISVVGEAASGSAAVDLVQRCGADVLVLDLAMPDQNGFDVLATLRDKTPGLAVLVFSALPEEHYAPVLFSQGAHGYLSKQCQPSAIVAAIRGVAAGRMCVSQAAAESIARQLDDSGSLRGLDKLSRREMQILLHLGKGQSTREAASVLRLSPKTVSTYRSRMMGKLGLHSNGDVVRFVLEQHLIE